MVKQTKAVAKQYKLIGRVAPLSYSLQTKNKQRAPLTWFDEDKKENRALRYARNQKSPFEDEQDGNAIMEPVVFVDGFLNVEKENQVLQEFLHYHPGNGKKFIEVDEAKDAETMVDEFNLQLDALNKARDMGVEEMETAARVLFNRDPSTKSTAELKRDLIIHAKKEPAHFLSALGNPELSLQANVSQFFDNGLLGFRKQKTEVWYNTPSNKTRMLVVPFGADAMALVTEHLKSDEGLEMLKTLEDLL